MADFEPQEEGLQPETVSEDAAQVETQPQTEQQEQADPFEPVARDYGWTPKEEWRGDPNDWRAPKDFISYGMKRSRESAEELKSLRTEVKSIGRVAEAIQRRNIEDAKREIEARFADAVENKDHEGARAAREELTRIDTAAAQPTHEGAVQDFMERNTWFGKNQAATFVAQGITAQLAAQGVSPDEQLRQAEAAVRAEFPQLFGQQQARAPAKAPAVNAPATRAAAPAQRAKGFNDLPANAQAAGRDFLKRGMVTTLDDYAKVYYAEEQA